MTDNFGLLELKQARTNFINLRSERADRKISQLWNGKYRKGKPSAPVGLYLDPSFREYVQRKYNSRDQSILDMKETLLLIYSHEWYNVRDSEDDRIRFGACKTISFNPELTN